MSLNDSVLVMSAEAENRLCAMRSLAKRSVKTVAISANPKAIGLLSRYPTKKYLLPSRATQFRLSYRDALLSLCKRGDILTIMPFTEADAYTLSTYKETFQDYVKATWVKDDVYENVRDRVKLLDLAKEAGLDVPKTRPLREWKDWSTPYVIKPRYSIMETDYGLYDLHDHVKIMGGGNKPDYESVEREMKHEPLVQQYIAGPEYGFFAIFNNGKARANFQHYRIRSRSYAGGISVFRRSTYSKALEEYGTKLLTALRWHGVAMVEVRFDIIDRKFKLLEVNPRFWGSLCLAIRAGVDFPYLYYEIASKGDCQPVFRYNKDITSQNLLGDVMYLHSILRARYPSFISKPGLSRELLSVIKSISRSNVEMLDRNDMLPFFADIWFTLLEARRKIFSF